MSRGVWWVGLAGLASVLVLNVGQAQQAERTPDEQATLDDEARQLFSAGETAYANGRFESALDYFTRAYELSGRAVLLYNVGLAAELARQDVRALEAYRGFLERVPDSEQRTRVQTRVRELEERIAAAAPVETETETEAVTASESEPESDTSTSVASASNETRSSTTGWVVFAASAAVVATGVVLGGLALSDISEVENAAPGSAWSDVRSAADRAEPLSIASLVALGVDVAGMGLGIALAITAPTRRGDEVALRVGPGGIAIVGSFR